MRFTTSKVNMKVDLLFQYAGGSDTNSLNLPDGLTLEIMRPTFRGIFSKENTLVESVWKIISIGKCWLFRVINNEGLIVHQSMMIGWNPKFSFLRKNEYEIGPCYTMERYRGRGIYPFVLQQIVKFGPQGKASEKFWKEENHKFYMFISEENISSIHGVEKAGFTMVGHIKRTMLGRWKMVK